MKSGAIAEFEAAGITETSEAHPKFRLEFAPPVDGEPGARRLVYLDRDDVSAVVVEENAGRGSAVAYATASAPLQVPVEVPDTIRQEVKEVLEGAAGA